MKRGLQQLVLDEMSKGHPPSKIWRKHNLRKQSVQNVVDKLKKEGKIRKISYANWTVQKEELINPGQVDLTCSSFQIRGHAFNWKVSFRKTIDWKKRLVKFKIKHKSVGNNKIPRLIINGKKIWLTKGGLVVYESKSFFERSSFTCKGRAVYELDKTIEDLGKLLQINLKPYKFTTLREHFAIIRNELARQYNNKGEKLYIKEDGNNWLWIDHSDGEHELESNEVMLNKKIQDWYNDQKKTKFEVTPSFLLESIGGMVNVQQMHSKNILKHQKVLDEMLRTLKQIRKGLSQKSGRKNT